MDQLRNALAWLKQHHFWVLVVLAVCVALGCWFRGASALMADFERDSRAIESEFGKIQGLASQPFHANDAINERQRTEIQVQRERVDALWRDLYDRQRAHVLKWPKNLNEPFHKHVEKLTFGDKIPQSLRAHYGNYIGNHFPELPKIVGALEMEGDAQGYSPGGYGGRGMGGYGGEMGGYGGEMAGGYGGMRRGENGETVEQQEFIVEWLDQPRIRADLFMPEEPTATKIWVTQEDLWVYEAMLRIVASTNEAKGADRFSNAAVRTIVSLEVGRLAAQASRGRGRIQMPQALPGAGMGMGLEGYGGGDEGGYGGYGGYGGNEGGYEGGYGGYGGERGGYESPMGGGYGSEMGGYGSEADPDAALFVGRYVDEQGNPIASTGEGGAEEYGKEFKRLPIRMELVMDQRWLPHLIAECANSPLQVMVNEVRVNPPGGFNTTGGGGSYGGGRGGESYDSYSGGQSGQEMLPESEPHIKPVAILGTIFIFNPPPAEDASSEQFAGQ